MIGPRSSRRHTLVSKCWSQEEREQHAQEVKTRPHIKNLAQHVQREQTVPGDGSGMMVLADILLDLDFVVTFISEGFVAKLQQK